MESKKESWLLLYSGVLFYATSSKKQFENYIFENLGKVYLGDDQACDMIGKSEVKIQLNESIWNLDKVKHAPNWRKNLISIG